jgi:Fe-S-cluster containining protein
MIENMGYKYKFDDSRCFTCEGNCCIGKSGYIWITTQEADKIAKYLTISVKDCFEKYLFKYKYRLSIKEKQLSKDNFACVFFNVEKKQCEIYEVRPKQCRTFPFWEYFKNNMQEVIEECPAIVLK